MYKYNQFDFSNTGMHLYISSTLMSRTDLNVHKVRHINAQKSVLNIDQHVGSNMSESKQETAVHIKNGKRPNCSC